MDEHWIHVECKKDKSAWWLNDEALSAFHKLIGSCMRALDGSAASDPEGFVHSFAELITSPPLWLPLAVFKWCKLDGGMMLVSASFTQLWKQGSHVTTLWPAASRSQQDRETYHYCICPLSNKVLTFSPSQAGMWGMKMELCAH